MGNTQTLPWSRPIKTSDASAMFHALDVEGRDFLTLKDLMGATAAGLMMPHSLPALYFFDEAKDGCITHAEFVSLVAFCQEEKRKVEEAFAHDKPFRDLILRASRAGVKDCSVHGRSSFRRFSSYSNVRSVFSARKEAGRRPERLGSGLALGNLPPAFPSNEPRGRPVMSRTPSDTSSEDAREQLSDEALRQRSEELSGHTSTVPSSESSISSDVEEEIDEDDTPAGHLRTVSMYSSQREFDELSSRAVGSEGDAANDLQDPKNRTALDAAVLENIMHANIHKLADLLHTEGLREQFMSWLWNLADFHFSGVVTLEELRVFLAALSEDGIDLEELVFYKEVGVPLEECIMNEFDTTHAGLLSRDEFMVLADLVTREYEFWENRHLERIGDYELGRTIGRGSSGVVRFAVHVETRRKVAIKIIKKGKCSDLSRLDREIQSLKAARHKHIVALEEVLDSESNLFIVMELCGGGSMVDIVRIYPEERMPEETARFFIRQIFEGLAFCHQNGICHRDVRLDNVMLDNSGNVKITDFGHSGIYTPGWDLFSTSLVGSIYNLSPEQLTGEVYSGEKIDVWSAGVAVYCLLVGRPPFYEPEVTPLLESITACEFEIPDFLSSKAKDLLHCMIRAVPEERITIQQMLHHPWFYDGPEFGPSMNVVVIPVDAFFKKRPDIAEMIMAITIYQHNLHFHLADTQNPNAPPEDQRGQNWTLKCLCPKNDIKFTVSLFTKEPQIRAPTRRKRHIPRASNMSCSVLPELNPGREQFSASNSSSTLPDLSLDMSIPAPPSMSVISANTSRTGLAIDVAADRAMRMATQKHHEINALQSVSGDLSTHAIPGFSRCKPPLQKHLMKITPLTVAAHIREHPNGNDDAFSSSDFFDLESDRVTRDFPDYSSRVGILERGGAGAKALSRSRVLSREARISGSGRKPSSQCVDGASNIVRLNRSAAVDAFPYQKVFPQRRMPDSARNLNFEVPDAQTSDNQDSLAEPHEELVQNLVDDHGTSHLRNFQLSSKMHTMSPFNAEVGSRAPGLAGLVAEGGIAEKIHRHPSKVLSPQAPQPLRTPLSSHVMPDASEGFTLTPTSQDVVIEETADYIEKEAVRRKVSDYASADLFEPYIKVQLQDGESGLFLKICRKLKTICTTKLAVAAERQRKKTVGRRSWSTLRRTASARSLGG